MVKNYTCTHKKLRCTEVSQRYKFHAAKAEHELSEKEHQPLRQCPAEVSEGKSNID
jgi:hypothetical protein